MSQRMRACGHCNELFEVAATGRPPKYCSSTCRKAAWEARRLAEQVAVAVARAVAAEQRRVANRGNETPAVPGNRGNETPSQARGPMGLEPLPGLDGDYRLAPPVPPPAPSVPRERRPAPQPRPVRRPLSDPGDLAREAAREWRRSVMRKDADAGDAGTPGGA